MTKDLAGGVTLHYADPDMAMGSWRHLFILVWRDNTTVEGVERLRRTFREWAADMEGPLALITVVQDNCPMPPADARTDLGRWLGEISDRVQASAVVYEGQGFRSASVRGVVTGLTMIARQAYPHKVFATVAEGAAWLGTMASSRGVRDISGEGIATAVRTLRAGVD